MPHTLYYFNALFDLELGGYPLESVRQSTMEMSSLFAFMGNSDDRILLDCEFPEPYWSYLDRSGIPHALPFTNQDNPADFEACPWGWNLPALDRLHKLGAICNYPDLDVVKMINDRAWCAAFNVQTGTGVPGSRFCAFQDDLTNAFYAPGQQFPLVAKPAFGSSGFGFVVVPQAEDLTAQKQALLDKMLERGGLTIEPWLDRICDLSSFATIGQDGGVTGERHYRCLTNSHGAFYAVLPGAPDPLLAQNLPALGRASNLAADALVKDGYFGPASFDSFLYRKGDALGTSLAAVIEVNGRHGMSCIAFALHDSLGRDRQSMFRFISRKQCSVPDSYDAFEELLGDCRYSPLTRTGILVCSPLRVQNGASAKQPARSAFFLCAQSEPELAKMDEVLIGALKR